MKKIILLSILAVILCGCEKPPQLEKIPVVVIEANGTPEASK